MERLLAFVITCAIVAGLQTSSAAPLPVADRTCLFLDDRFVAEQSGLKRIWHQGRPRPQVAIQEEKQNAWEKWPHMFGSVIHDPQDGLYKMYYESAIAPARKGEGRTASFTCYICYAESQDGKSWTKPKLGLFEDLGSTANNIVVTDAELAKVLIDPRATDPAKRLKMIVHLQRSYPWPDGGQGECVLSSGDGRRWKFERGFENPTYADPEYGASYTDTRMFMWDPVTQLFRASIRTFAKSHVAEKPDNRRRAVGVSESKIINGNYKDWTPIVQVLAPDDRDDVAVAKLSQDPAKPDWAEQYCMTFFRYGNHYLGFLSLLYFIDGSDSNGGGDLQLTFSHDARAWQRQPDRQTLIAPSNATPALFPTYIQMNEPLMLGSEMWVYYTEANGAHPKATNPISQIRAAVWRKDGFVSLDAAGRGSLTTPPLATEGKELLINFETKPGGFIRVGLLDETGKPIKQFDMASCQPLKGDAITQKVEWVLGSDFSKASEGKAVRLAFELHQARLWSFRFAQ